MITEVMARPDNNDMEIIEKKIALIVNYSAKACEIGEVQTALSHLRICETLLPELYEDNFLSSCTYLNCSCAFFAINE
jgi:hypothetical protein